MWINALVIIVLLPGTFVSFNSLRTGETLLKARRLVSGLIVHGDARRDRYDVELRSEGVYLDGTLWDRRGPAISLGDGALRFHTKVIVDCGLLTDD